MRSVQRRATIPYCRCLNLKKDGAGFTINALGNWIHSLCEKPSLATWKASQ